MNCIVVFGRIETLTHEEINFSEAYFIQHYRLSGLHDQILGQRSMSRAQGNMLAERAGKGKKQESGLVGPGSVVGAAAFLSSTRSRTAVRAAGTCRLAAFGPQELEALLVRLATTGHICLACDGRATSPDQLLIRL